MANKITQEAKKVIDSGEQKNQTEAAFSKMVKEQSTKEEKKDEKPAEAAVENTELKRPAIVVTSATHARELISI